MSARELITRRSIDCSWTRSSSGQERRYNTAAPMKFFDPHGDIRFTQNRLPHWQQSGAVYFITFRLGDALPRNLLERWKEERNAWLKWHPLPWSADMERE